MPLPASAALSVWDADRSQLYFGNVDGSLTSFDMAKMEVAEHWYAPPRHAPRGPLPPQRRLQVRSFSEGRVCAPAPGLAEGGSATTSVALGRAGHSEIVTSLVRIRDMNALASSSMDTHILVRSPADRA
jgi:hypothetical protein